MAKNKVGLNQRFSISIFLGIGVLFGCASIQQPQGGPKDTEPPKILKMTPKNMTTNFKARTVVIEFDEYFKLADQFKEFSISPETDLPPILKTRQKRLEIEFQDTLEANTTYTLNFGKAIVDVNESNAVKNFTYVFSTGAQLDSLSISGKVTNAVTGEPQLEALAFLLPLNRDTLLGKGKPSIYTLTDSSGNYQMSNLKEGAYRIYALMEKGGDKIYQQNTDEIGFVSDTIVLDKNINNVNIQVFKEDAKVFRILDRKLNSDGTILFAFNQKLRKPELTVVEPANLDATKRIQFNKSNDTAKVWLTDLGFDSVKFDIKDEGKLLQTVKINRGKKDTYTRNILPADNIEGNKLNPNKNLQLIFNLPIERFDISKVSLLEDSVSRTNFTIARDSTNLLIYNFRYPWKNKRDYEIGFAEGAFTAIFDAKNKEFTKKFELASADEYGTLILSLDVPDSTQKFVLEIVDEKKNVISAVPFSNDTTVTLANYKAGIYHARIVFDSNRNGIWDTGDVTKGIQPEKIWYETKELSIRANWDRKEIVTIPKE